MLEEGTNIKDFKLPDFMGKLHTLGEFSGKWIVLYFYPKDNTSGCTKEAQDFTELIDNFDRLGAVVIGISPDSVESHRGFVEKHGLKVLLLSDASKEVLTEYGAWGKKKVCGKESWGVIRSTFLISPEGKIVKVWRNVRVRSKRKDREVKHAEVVMEFLKGLVGRQ